MTKKTPMTPKAPKKQGTNPFVSNPAKVVPAKGSPVKPKKTPMKGKV